MPKRTTISIVGCGCAGGAIGLALKRNGFEIAAAWSRSRAGRNRAQRLLEAPVLDDPGEVAAAADLAIVAVPDDAILEMAERIASSGARVRRVAHTSGAVSVDALGPLREAGAATGSVHPLQTLPDPLKGADALQGAAVAVTAKPEHRSYLYRIARGWGGRPFDLSDEDKTRYHAAAVFASNYVVTAVWASTVIFREMGIAKPMTLLGPLLREAAENTALVGPAKAITGPVVRGDVQVVQQHVEALAEIAPPELAQAYRALARLTAALVGLDPHILDEVDV